MIASKFKFGAGIGVSESPLVSFDKSLLDAGVGNYNLVKLSSILPAHCELTEQKIDIPEGSLLPVAYATISSNTYGDRLVSTIGVGLPEDEDKVGVIMEYSTKNVDVEEAIDTLKSMISEAFEVRGWELKKIKYISTDDVVNDERTHTTFACIAEW